MNTHAKGVVLPTSQTKTPAHQETFEHIVWPYRLLVPLLYLTGAYVQAKKFVFKMLLGRKPETNCWFVDGLSINSRRVKDGAARWPSLAVTYNFTEGEGSNALSRVVDTYWLHVRNAQAVRNRLIIVERELTAAIESVSAAIEGAPVRILSLAAGSGQAVIDVVAQLRQKGVRCEVLLIDQDESAIDYANTLAQERGVSDCVSTKQADVVYFERETKNFHPDVIEMCGLMDYLQDRLAIVLIKKIHRTLNPDGFFLTCHIHPNHERYFLWHVVNWGMLYRTRRELNTLLVEGGFLTSRLHTEPHRIHSVAVAQKK